MAASPLASIGKLTELRQRILYVLGAMVIFRIGAHIPIPGVDPTAVAELFAQTKGSILDVFNMFSGGALKRMSILALGVLPYISASIIMQMMTAVVPQLEQLKKEGEAGRRKITQYTRYGTVILATFQGLGIAVGLEGMTSSQGTAVQEPGLAFRATTVITLVGGTIFLMWLGEQITARGVGNGISMIIMAGSVAELPSAMASTLELGRTGALSALFIILLMVMAVGVIAFIVFVERAQRRLLVQYPKRQVGNRMFGGESTHLPLKLNTAGVIPPIFASSLLLLPITAMSFSANAGPDWLGSVAAMLSRGSPGYLFLYISLIVFFAFFYTSVVFNPEDTADNLKKNNGFIPGIRPGKNTAEYIDFVLRRLTTVGAIYLSAVCVLPEILISKYGVPFYFGGTSLLIVVNVNMDFVAQVHSHLLAHQYEGLIKKSRLRGRRG